MTDRADEVEKTRARLARKASGAVLDSRVPAEDPAASWFGRVRLALPHETWPVSGGKPMLPLAQFNLAEMPYRPENLSDIALITVFIDGDELPYETKNGDGWLLRAYHTMERLVPTQDQAPDSHIEPHPLRWELIEDYPTADEASDLGVPDLMNEDQDEGYAELFECQQGTKIGGWPFGAQGTVEWRPSDRHAFEPEYVFQIDSEGEARWMWGDAGFGYFGRGTGEHRDVWVLEWQSY